MKTEKSKQLFERASRVFPGGVNSPVRGFKGLGMSPIFFESAQGAVLKSVDGDEYIDYCQSFGPLILGHRDPEVNEAVLKMIGTAWTFGACEPYSLELGELITSKIPFVEKCRFVSSGTEAVMSALRVARGATGRHKVLKFDGCYHGHLDSLLVKAGSGLAGASSSSSAGVSEEVASETLTIPLDDDAELEKVFAERGLEIAALILEPLPANYGLLIQREDFIRKAVNLARQSGALVIFDEVISGFRMGFGGMAEILDIKPDLVTYGKILGGGFPVGCYGGRKDLMDQVAPVGPVYQAGTLSANPVGMAAGLATLKKLLKEDTYPVLEKKTERLASGLNQAFESRKIPVRVAHKGSLFWIHTSHGEPIRRVDQIPAKHGTKFQRFFPGALEGGVYLAPNAYEVGFMSLAHTDEQIQKTIHVVSNAVISTHA